MNKFPFYAALEHARDMYGIELDEDKYETYAMSAWGKIGNKDYKTYITNIYPECDPEGGWFVCKPCNLDSIEAITLPCEYAQEVNSIHNNYGAITHPIEQNIENSKSMPNHLYVSGKLVKYKELGDRIYFTEPFPVLTMLYKGLYTDEDGFPFLSEKEVEAIALYCAYSVFFKKGLMSKDQSELVIAQSLKKDWATACRSARVPKDISQNSMNEILDAFVRRDIHRYGSTYKPIH